MRVTLLGTGSAFPSPDRLQTGILLEADGRRLLVDCGSGVVHRLAQAGVPHGAVETVLLTHHHLDHVCDLPTLLKARTLDGLRTFTVEGPAGTRAVCGHLFAVDDITGRADVTIVERQLTDFPDTIAGFQVAAATTTHSKPCFAYRFGDALAISGDTAPDPDVFALADGVHTLVHECAFADGVESDGHTTPSELGRGLAGIDVERVLLTHLFPETEHSADELVATVGEYTDAEITVPADLTTLELPA